ncbi:TRM13 [Candida pseudojiufengensis]|uniref:TRM13 n=1 Tax=Candida pseudojiufengensis TaxID=497109 RepID=UPI0022253DE5|nr:TRM13 [Candida pseudojiufengensis]KAI5966854.1 TRM13 [Candida pseudojiufengensis]
MSDFKRQKIEKPVANRCEYIVTKKNKTKQCGMMRKKENKYCAEHMIYDTSSSNTKRISCPLNPNHTVWETDLKFHLTKCNANPKVNKNSYFELDINSNLQNYEEFMFETESTRRNDQHYRDILDNLSFEPLDLHICEHPGLTTQLESKTYKKHIVQQSSLIGNLKRLGLLSSEHFYLEYGCGKAELSRYVNQCIIFKNVNDFKSYGYGLIDRGNNRMKADSKIIQDSEPYKFTPRIKRAKIDIKDLKLDEFLDNIKPKQIVAISKHLCGAATDLTLKSIINSSIIKDNQFSGILIAMCCRHVCSDDQLLPQSKQFLYDHGFKSVDAFNRLKKMVSWAVNIKEERSKSDAIDKNEESKENEGKEDEHSKNEDEESSCLTSAQRYEYGLKARKLIDESRLHALRTILGDEYDVNIFWYVESNITKENVCLSITKKNSKDK